MAGNILIALTIVALVSASDIQEQIRQLQADIKAIQNDLAEETDFLRNTQEKVNELEELIAEAISDRNEASKSFLLFDLPYYPSTSGVFSFIVPLWEIEAILDSPCHSVFPSFCDSVKIWFSLNILNISGRIRPDFACPKTWTIVFRKIVSEFSPLIDVRFFLLNIFSLNCQNLTKFCIVRMLPNFVCLLTLTKFSLGL